MEKISYYSQENHGPYQVYNLGDFELEEGGIINDCQIAYSTFGKLNPRKDNAILITTWYSGTSKIMEQVYQGEGRAIDPAKYFIVIINQIGNGLSTSPHSAMDGLKGAKFPRVRISDDVRAQYRLLTELFGIESLALVVGGSMGAQQTWEWAVRYPDMVKRAVPIAGRARNTRHNFLFIETLKYALMSDPNWNEGNYTDSNLVSRGLKHHADLWSVMGFSIEFYKQELYKNLGFSSLEEFRVGFTQGYFLPMDPNNLLCMAWKWQKGDVSRITNGDLSAALGRIKSKVLILAIDGDMLYPPSDCEADQKLTPNSEMRIIHSYAGHLGLFGIEPSFSEQVDKYLKEILDTPIEKKISGKSFSLRN
ncbi:alpha/beta fold hydrolase [Echinicola jeungdonensis]|uniref:Alpha/beta fold hydrolase n=1 Tax=Echinicola jeungdonensis TaxID=709343 RepID=A0ABV5J756_9BACT|nr:alpha/beta fold hydrolase [Echinicola jeungdonensis]MDN3670718.1 alpha/beta fold hydrolase [Echinicola jeungdonensis]